MTSRPEPVNLDDYAALAAQVLDENARAYIDGGAGDEHTLRANRDAWASIHLRPRVLRDLGGGHTGVRLLGRSLAHPLLLAPVAFQRLVHPDGERATALAAAAQGAGLVLSMQSSVTLEEVAAAVHGMPERGPLWFQLVLLHDRGFMKELIGRAESAGFEALVLTVDAPVSGVRDRERRAGFHLPTGVKAVNLAGLAPRETTTGSVFHQLMSHAATWSDVEWLRSMTRLPVVLKGVLRDDDAAQAVSLGVDGLIVSNHGGRTLDGVVATAWALPQVVQAAGEVPVLVDGGIRRGVDVLRACALGARAVLIGRPQVHALSIEGALGVARVIRLLRDELEVSMALAGCSSLSGAGRELIHTTGARHLP